MSNRIPAIVVAAIVAVVAPHAGAARSQHGRTRLANSGADITAAGNLSVKRAPATRKRPERAKITIKVRYLDPVGHYELWMDDPATPTDHTLLLVADSAFGTNTGGRGRLTLDSAHPTLGRPTGMPFSAAVEALQGMEFEVRQAPGPTVLLGAIPSVR